ncbi:hypothetical protein BP5796_12455 [Coleophoma crateriformis]|uniref:3-beta hydroxysteroid dehydrogenase/isomerase domain-containing protein n=1 Tax=Coleophoma crateriformis TaxID=565419 RepID=A0A3D8Q891_9HELO|nr:hypothetical protein BP5796_12455 [Coleophoma crateriformis]
MAQEVLKGESILVTGGEMFIGYHIVSYLLSQDPNLTISVLDHPSIIPRFPTVEYYDVDFSSQLAVTTALRSIRPTVIFHAACTYSLALPAPTFHKVNFQETKSVLSAAQDLGTVKALIYHSSSSVIEHGTSSLISATEDLPVLFAPDQKFPYPLSKALAEKLVLDANGQHGILTCSIRPAAPFGEADTETVEKLIQNARAGRANTQIGDGRNVYDFLYVGNLAHAHVLAANALLKGGRGPGGRVDGEAFQITNDEPWLFWDLTRAIAKGVGHEVKKEDIRSIPVWIAWCMAFMAEWWVWAVSRGQRQSVLTRSGIRYATKSRTIDISKAKRVLGYRPIWSMNQGLERTLKWYQKE